MYSEKITVVQHLPTWRSDIIIFLLGFCRNILMDSQVLTWPNISLENNLQINNLHAEMHRETGHEIIAAKINIKKHC